MVPRRRLRILEATGQRAAACGVTGAGVAFCVKDRSVVADAKVLGCPTQRPCLVQKTLVARVVHRCLPLNVVLS